MRFLAWIGNHTLTGQRSLEDPIGIFGHQLRALGHEVVWDPRNHQFLLQDSGINILVEGFTDASIAVIAEGHRLGARFICLATEEPTPKGFNHGRDREMVKRQEKFAEASKYFEAIFHLVPGKQVTEWYGQFAPSAFVELGYAPTLLRRLPLDKPAFNFGFFGSLTHRRLKILKRLAKSIGTVKAVRVEATFPTQEDRDRIMREARVIVQLRKHEEMGLVSSSRINTALCLGRPVVAEPHLLDQEWRNVIKFSDTLDSFYNDCLMAQAAWEGVWAAQFDKFKQKMSPENCVGRAIREVNLDLNYRPLKKAS